MEDVQQSKGRRRLGGKEVEVERGPGGENSLGSEVDELLRQSICEKLSQVRCRLLGVFRARGLQRRTERAFR